MIRLSGFALQYTITSGNDPEVLVASGQLAHSLIARAPGHRFHHAVEVEATGPLARWKLAEALQPLPDKGRCGSNREHTFQIPALEAHGVFGSNRSKSARPMVTFQVMAIFPV